MQQLWILAEEIHLIFTSYSPDICVPEALYCVGIFFLIKFIIFKMVLHLSV